MGMPPPCLWSLFAPGGIKGVPFREKGICPMLGGRGINKRKVVGNGYPRG